MCLHFKVFFSSVLTKVLMKQLFLKINMWKIRKKEINKQSHTKEGNKRKDYLHAAWWNNKRGQNQLGKNTGDSLALMLSKHDIDIIGLSESNILKDDDKGTTKIKGYDTINDNIFKLGKSRSSIYVRSGLKCKIRYDLMEEDTPEVWL